MGRRSVRIRNFFQGRKGSEFAKCVHKGWVKETHRYIYIYTYRYVHRCICAFKDAQANAFICCLSFLSIGVQMYPK